MSVVDFQNHIRSAILTILEDLPEEKRALLMEKAKTMGLLAVLRMVSQEAMKGYREPDFLRGRE